MRFTEKGIVSDDTKYRPTNTEISTEPRKKYPTPTFRDALNMRAWRINNNIDVPEEYLIGLRQRERLFTLAGMLAFLSGLLIGKWL